MDAVATNTVKSQKVEAGAFINHYMLLGQKIKIRKNITRRGKSFHRGRGGLFPIFSPQARAGEEDLQYIVKLNNFFKF